MNGHNCDYCGRSLNENDYERYGSWSYHCSCGFTYKHGRLTAAEQVANFEERLDEEDELYNEDIDEDEDE